MSWPLKRHPTLSCVYLEILQRNTEGAPQNHHSSMDSGPYGRSVCGNGRSETANKTNPLKYKSYLSKKMSIGGYGSDYPFREKEPWMVADSYGQMEPITHKQPVELQIYTDASSTGGMDKRQTSSGFLEQKATQHALELPPNVCSASSSTLLLANGNRFKLYPTIFLQ